MTPEIAALFAEFESKRKAESERLIAMLPDIMRDSFEAEDQKREAQRQALETDLRKQRELLEQLHSLAQQIDKKLR